ncbi:MAG: hypothetical protein GX115_15255 [Ruminiclostridium sp.]|nr:hypothetical protein [Ruminiclostridium sp.]
MNEINQCKEEEYIVTDIVYDDTRSDNEWFLVLSQITEECEQLSYYGAYEDMMEYIQEHKKDMVLTSLSAGPGDNWFAVMTSIPI